MPVDRCGGLCAAVKTEVNPFGEITPEEYEKITGREFPQQ
ncbi:XkdX family protein [Paenibacillus thiaminolyticus]